MPSTPGEHAYDVIYRATADFSDLAREAAKARAEMEALTKSTNDFNKAQAQSDKDSKSSVDAKNKSLAALLKTMKDVSVAENSLSKQEESNSKVTAASAASMHTLGNTNEDTGKKAEIAGKKIEDAGKKTEDAGKRADKSSGFLKGLWQSMETVGRGADSLGDKFLRLGSRMGGAGNNGGFFSGFLGSLGDFGGAFNTVIGGAMKAVGSLAPFSAALVGVGTLLPGIIASVGALGTGFLGLLGAVGPAVGILATMIPLAVAAGGAMVVLAVAVKPVISALSALASGNPAKINAAFKNLSPAAREAALALNDFRKAVTGINGKDIQQAFWEPLIKPLKDLPSIIKPISGFLKDMAGAMGSVAAQLVGGFTKWANSPGFKIITTTAVTSVRNIGGAFVTWLDILGKIGVAAAPLTNWMTSGLKQGAQNIDKMVSSAQGINGMTRFFDQSRFALEKLGGILKGFGGGLINLMITFAPLGNAFLTWLDSAAQKFRTWTQNHDFTNWMKATSDFLKAIGGLIGTVVGGFIQLGSHAASLQVITSIFKALNDILKPIFRIINDIIILLEPFDRELAKFITTIGAVVGKVFSKIADVLDKLTQNKAGAAVLSTLLGALGSVVVAASLFALIDKMTTLLKLPVNKFIDLLNHIPGVDIKNIGPADKQVGAADTMLRAATIQADAASGMVRAAGLQEAASTGGVGGGGKSGGKSGLFGNILGGLLVGGGIAFAGNQLADSKTRPGTAPNLGIKVGSDALGGAAAGFMIGGPIGAAVGGVGGALAGAFSDPKFRSQAKQAAKDVEKWFMDSNKSIGHGFMQYVGTPLANFFTSTVPRFVRNLGSQFVNVNKQMYQDFMKNFGSPLARFFTETLPRTFGHTIPDFFKRMWNDVSGFAKRIWNDVTGWFKRTYDDVTNWFKRMWNDVSGFARRMWNDVSGFARRIWNDVTGWFKRTYDDVITFSKRIWNDVSGWFKRTWTDVSGFVKRMWNDVSGFVQRMWNDVSGFARRIWSDVSGWFKRTYDDVISFVRRMWNDVSGFFQRIWNDVSGFARRIWNDVTNWFRNLWRDITTIARDIWTATTSTFSNIWRSVTDTAKRIWNDVKGAFVGLKNDIVQIFKDIANNGFIVPINFVTQNVLDPIFGAINTVASWVGLGNPLPHINPIGRFATGGTVPGPDHITYDSVHAMLVPGEFVIPKEAAKKLGPTLLERLRHADKYASGGPVVGGTLPGGTLPQAPITGKGLAPGSGGLFGSIPGVQSIINTVKGWIQGALQAGAKALMDPLVALIPTHPGLSNMFHGGAQKLENGILSLLGKKDQQAQAALASAGSAGPGTPSGVAQQYAASRLGAYGMSPSSMGNLIKLWNQESGWNSNAVNVGSGAYGIPQALGHGHPFALGDYKAQVDWGLNYIKGRYGSPDAAWAHEVANNWYSRGGSVDTVKARLTPGEFVIRKQAVDKLGLSALNKLNHADIQHFSSGGLVNASSDAAVSAWRDDNGTKAQWLATGGTSQQWAHALAKEAKAAIQFHQQQFAAATAKATAANVAVTKTSIGNMSIAFGKGFAGFVANSNNTIMSTVASTADGFKNSFGKFAVAANSTIAGGAGYITNSFGTGYTKFNVDAMGRITVGFGKLTNSMVAAINNMLQQASASVTSPQQFKKIQAAGGQVNANSGTGVSVNSASDDQVHAWLMDNGTKSQWLASGGTQAQWQHGWAIASRIAASVGNPLEASLNRATGGPVWGESGVDKVKARLTSGEYVIRKEAADRLGLATLNRLNQADSWKFATGGAVMPDFNIGTASHAYAPVGTPRGLSKAAHSVTNNTNTGVEINGDINFHSVVATDAGESFQRGLTKLRVLGGRGA